MQSCEARSAKKDGARGRYCPSCQTVIGRRRRFSGSRARWCSVEDLNPGMSVCRTDAFGRLANGAICLVREGRFERPLSGV